MRRTPLGPGRRSPEANTLAQATRNEGRPGPPPRETKAERGALGRARSGGPSGPAAVFLTSRSPAGSAVSSTPAAAATTVAGGMSWRQNRRNGKGAGRTEKKVPGKAGDRDLPRFTAPTRVRRREIAAAHALAVTSPRRPRPCHVGLVWVSRGPAPGVWASAAVVAAVLECGSPTLLTSAGGAGTSAVGRSPFCAVGSAALCSALQARSHFRPRVGRGSKPLWSRA